MMPTFCRHEEQLAAIDNILRKKMPRNFGQINKSGHSKGFLARTFKRCDANNTLNMNHPIALWSFLSSHSILLRGHRQE
jgi:hypothetical protein